jgi:hypothetical protein
MGVKQWHTMLCESIGKEEKRCEEKFFWTVNQRVAGSSPAGGAK